MRYEETFEYYHLDMVISVGYRIKSKRGVDFRCPGHEKTTTLRQLVFTADNILQDGFGTGRTLSDYE